MTVSRKGILEGIQTALAVVYPGDRRYPLADRVEAVPLGVLATPGGLFAGQPA